MSIEKLCFPFCGKTLNTFIPGYSDYDILCNVITKINEVIDYSKNMTIKYADPIEWDITTQYSANTVVVDGSGNAYLSVQPVPDGIQLSDTDYWTKIGNFDELWRGFKRAISLNDEGAKTTASKKYVAGELVWLNNTLYKVNTTMPVGTEFVIDNNVSTVTVEELLDTLGKDFSDKLDKEISDRETSDSQIEQTITEKYTDLSNKLAKEVSDREEADSQIEQTITEKYNDLSNKLTTETQERIGEDSTLNNKMDKIESNVDSLSIFITPEMYGAKGDGTTDDTSAVQAAFNAATANKPIILTGQYYCTDTIAVKRDTTVIGAATRPRAILIPYFIFNNGVSPAFSVVGTQDEDVDYGGTLENVTFKGVTIALKSAATAACVAFQVQWARFFTLDYCSVYGFTTAVNFANCNGVTIRNFEYGTNGSVNVTVFNKFNNGGNTGLKLQHITVNNFSDGITKADVLSDTTGDGQSGDRWFEDWLCVGPWNTVIYYTHGNGFSRHVYINRIFADNLLDNLVYLVGSGANEDAQITDIGCVGDSGQYRGLFVQGYCRLTVSGVAGASDQSTYDFVSLNSATDVMLTNVMLDGPATYFISVVGGSRIAVCNTRNSQTGNINVSNDASYCQWCNISTVGANNLLVTTGSNNQATNVYPQSTN